MEILKMIYEKKEEEIQIFNPFFIKNNKIKCKMMIKNMLLSITDKYKFTDKNQKYLKIKLIILVKDKLNFSNMYRNCTSLKKVYLFSQKNDIIKNKNESLSIVNKNDYDDIFMKIIIP